MSVLKPKYLLRFAGAGTTLTSDGTAGGSFTLVQGATPTNFTQTAAAGTYDGQYNGKTNNSSAMPYGTTTGTQTGVLEAISFHCKFLLRSCDNSVAAILGRGDSSKGMRVRALTNGAGFDLNVRVDSSLFGQMREINFLALTFNTAYSFSATFKTSTPTVCEIRAKLNAGTVQTSTTQDWDGDTLDTEQITFAKPDDFTDIRGFDGTMDDWAYWRGVELSDTDLGDLNTNAKTTITGWPGVTGTQNLTGVGALGTQALYGAHTVIDVNPTAQPGGLGSSAAYGTHTLAKVAARTLGPVGGVGSAVLYGSHTLAITTLKVIQTTGIASQAATGSHTLAKVAARTLGPVGGLASPAVFGSHTLSQPSISQGIPSPAVYGSFTISSSGTKVIGLANQGIPSQAATGAHVLSKGAVKTIAPGGIASQAATGSHSLAKIAAGTLAPGGIASPAAMGNHTIVQSGTRAIPMQGIPSVASVGGHTIRLASYVPKISGRGPRRRRG